jgi:bacillithiol biosynthesis deacetylase BshB1
MKLDVLAIGAHPDDVELGCGATVALLARQGRRVGILHLTRGERGTRGTAEERLAEAERAASALGVADLAFLDTGDGGLRTGPAEEDALIEVLRTWRPDLVLGPAPSDRHPDHGRAQRLVEAACFYSGLANRGAAHPATAAHRPAAFFSYMQHDPFEPSVQPGERPSGPVTKVSTEDFSLMVEGRARHFGSLIGATFGEPFWNRLPLAVSDPFLLLPGGVR